MSTVKAINPSMLGRGRSATLTALLQNINSTLASLERLDGDRLTQPLYLYCLFDALLSLSANRPLKL